MFESDPEYIRLKNLLIGRYLQTASSSNFTLGVFLFFLFVCLFVCFLLNFSKFQLLLLYSLTNEEHIVVLIYNVIGLTMTLN